MSDEAVSKQLKTCPWCEVKPHIKISDNEGNPRSEDYLNDPYSGISYYLSHEIENCPIATHIGDESILGTFLYDTKEQAITAWNTRPQDDAKDKEITKLKECLASSNRLTQCAIDKTIEQDKRIKELKKATEMALMACSSYPQNPFERQQLIDEARKILAAKEINNE